MSSRCIDRCRPPHASLPEWNWNPSASTITFAFEEGHVRSLSRIKDLNARVKLPKRVATEGWTVKMTEERVAMLLAKAHKRPLKTAGKTAPSRQYEYNGFRC